MDGPGPQERASVRCIAPGIIRSEVFGEPAVKGQADLVKHSCAGLMEADRNYRTRDRTPADKTNQTVAVDNNGIANPSNGIENKESSNPNCPVASFNSNGLDSKTCKIKQIVEDAISPDSKHAVMRILDQVNELSTTEKLLLYLKLPTGKSGNVDPLRQPLNPLGSRFEIQQTITWIKTHLEEDQDVSLPKQDVYDEYIGYCNSNAMKPLSTADFGKVMKQVFPRVRPRRLGTRGNSRYCYAGMRKKMKLETPLLPDLGEDIKPNIGSCSEDEMVSAASCLIREWAEKLLGIRFESLRDLAKHLVEKMCVDSRSVAAFTILNATSQNKVTPNLSSTKMCADKVAGGGGLSGISQNKHREAQLQLQRKLQEREVIREQKRKLQEQAAAAVTKSRGKRAKVSRETSTNVATQGEEANCDKAGRKKKPAKSAPNAIQENGTETKPVSTNKTPTTFSPVRELNLPPVSKPVDTAAPSKLPIPRLANPNKSASKQLANVIIFPPILQPQSPKKKYKPIQPKPEDGGKKEASIDVEDYNSQEQEEELMRYFQHQNSSSSNEEAEEKSDKLSQLRLLLERNLEPEGQTTPRQPTTAGPASTSLSLLSQRSQVNSTNKPALLLPSLLTNNSNNASLSSRRRVSFETSVMEHYQDATVPQSPNTRRRIFSFTPISPGPHSPQGTHRISSKPSSANASPFVSPRNTPVPRSRHNSGQPLFPVRARHSAAAKVVRSNSVNSQYQMPRPTFAIPTGPPPMSPLSISAPHSPMVSLQQTENGVTVSAPPMQFPDSSNSLLQAVLQAPTDPLSQEVSQFFSDSEQNLASAQLQYRSQSVPLHRMTSAHISPQQQESPLYISQSATVFNFNNFSTSATSSVAPTPVPSEFTDFVSTGGENSTAHSTDLLMVNNGDCGDADTAELNSENLNRIFNLLDDVQEENQKEQQQLSLKLDNEAAQQNSHKFLLQPSRSYPNTPLPYQPSSTRDPVVSSFATALSEGSSLTSRSYPSTPLVGLHGFGGSEDDGPFQEGLGEEQITLNELNVRTTARRNINSLLDQPPFSVDDELALDTLDALQECETFTQFVQEVNDSENITD